MVSHLEIHTARVSPPSEQCALWLRPVAWDQLGEGLWSGLSCGASESYLIIHLCVSGWKEFPTESRASWSLLGGAGPWRFRPQCGCRAAITAGAHSRPVRQICQSKASEFLTLHSLCQLCLKCLADAKVRCNQFAARFNGSFYWA